MSGSDWAPVRIGIVSISDRASSGVYEDLGLPALQSWLQRALLNPIEFEARLIPDEADRISATLIDLAHLFAKAGHDLVRHGQGGLGRDVAQRWARATGGEYQAAAGLRQLDQGRADAIGFVGDEACLKLNGVEQGALQPAL